MKHRKSRRDFLKETGAAIASVPLFRPQGGDGTNMPFRRLGKTNEQVSLIGLGGAHVGYEHVSEKGAVRIMHAAIDGGVNFFDNSWDYNGGRSEERMGAALANGKRQKVFLMTKFCCHREGWSKRVALRMLEESLKRLRTDYLDLWQLHEVIAPDHPERALAPDSAVEALLEARESGKIRYVGFTGHRDPGIHLKMLDGKFSFDAVQMPLNVLDHHFRSFEKRVLPVLQSRQIGVIGMKPLGGGSRLGAIPQTKAVNALECLHYVMHLPVSTIVTGIPSETVLEQALEAARTFQPWSQGEMARLLQRTRPVAETGQHERYKTG